MYARGSLIFLGGVCCAIHFGRKNNNFVNRPNVDGNIIASLKNFFYSY